MSKAAWRDQSLQRHLGQRLIGPSGTRDAYQVDHIVPVRVCWQHKISALAAAHPANLQVVPWTVNAIRARPFELKKMVGFITDPPLQP
jgi:hypothetical protein